MKKLLVSIFFVTLFMSILSGYAFADVAGYWDVTCIENISFNGKGIKTIKETLEIYDDWDFKPNSTFVGDDYEGTWKQKKNNITIYANLEQLEELYEHIVSYWGYNVDVTIKKATISGKEQKDGTIKGSYSITANLVFKDFKNVKGKLTVKGTFIGSKYEEEQKPPEINTQVWIFKLSGWDLHDSSGYKENFRTDKLTFYTRPNYFDITGYIEIGNYQGSPRFEIIGAYIEPGNQFGAVPEIIFQYCYDDDQNHCYKYDGRLLNENEIKEGTWQCEGGQCPYATWGTFTGHRLY